MTIQAARVIGTLAGLLAICGTAVSGQERGTRKPPQTDRTVTVTKGSRLSVNNDAGEVVLRTWDRDSVRVQASHNPRTTIDVQTSGNIVTIRSRASGGPAGGVDYEITAPVWLPVKVSGQFLYIGIEGAQNEISAETVRGDIVVKGGSGFVTAKSIEGEIIVEGAKGRINASSVNEGIRITGAIGDVTAESTNGDIVLEKIEAKSLEVTTVNGDIRYEGSIPGGLYRFSTHNGDITMTVPEATNATFTVRTYNGDFQSNLPTKRVGEGRRGQRATYTLGTGGGAEVELESFGGTVRLRRPGTVPAPRGQDKEKNDHKNDESQSARSATIGSTCAARAAGVAAAATAVSVSTTATVAKVQGS
jgi:hypothetical protein